MSAQSAWIMEECVHEPFEEIITWDGIHVWGNHLIWPHGKIQGYGSIRSVYGNRTHIITVQARWGIFEGKEQTRHLCGRKDCCAPWHLRKGTQKQNNIDGHTIDPGPHGSSKLKGKVEEIDRRLRALEVTNPSRREMNQLFRELGEQYGVSLQTIADLQSGGRWSYITGRGS